MRRINFLANNALSLLATNAVFNQGNFWSNVATQPYPNGLTGPTGTPVCGFLGAFWSTLMTNRDPAQVGCFLTIIVFRFDGPFLPYSLSL